MAGKLATSRYPSGSLAAQQIRKQTWVLPQKESQFAPAGTENGSLSLHLARRRLVELLRRPLDGAGGGDERLDQRCVCEFPDSHFAIVAAGGDESPVITQRQGVNPVAVAVQSANGSAGVGVPDAHGVV